MTARPGSYTLAIDIGAATVTAALQRGGVVTVVSLGGDCLPMSTAVRSSPAGPVVVDEPARAPSPLDLGDLGRPTSSEGDGAEPTTAERVRALLDEVLARVVDREGEPPDELVLAHPAACPSTALAHLGSIARDLGVTSVRLVPAPVAALRGRRDPLPEGEYVLVVGLDDQGVEAAVLRTERAGPELAGPPSTFSPHRDPRVTAAGTSSTDAVHQALRDAGTELRAVAEVLLVGRWSREPGLVSLFSELLGRPVSADRDTETTVVLGAAAAMGEVGPVRAGSPSGDDDAVDQSPPASSTPVLDDDVQVTVYRPTRIRPQRWYTLLAFVHRCEPTIETDTGQRLDPLAMVREQAERFLAGEEGVFGPVAADTALPLARGSTLVVEPWLDGGVVNPPRAWLAWEEPVHRLPFRLRVPSEHDGRRLAGGLRVFLGVVLVSEVTFTVSVSGSAALADSPEPVSARRYREIFASYSRRDVEIVRSVASTVAVIGDRYIIDSQALRSGERWESRLDELIERADVFQLFWSRNAMRSPQVRREWEFALRLGREGFIRPVYWEEPLAADPVQRLPPPEIGALHWAWLPPTAPFGASARPVPIPVGRAGGAPSPVPVATSAARPQPRRPEPPPALQIPHPRQGSPSTPLGQPGHRRPAGPRAPSSPPPPAGPARRPAHRTRWTLVGGASTTVLAVIAIAVGINSANTPPPASSAAAPQTTTAAPPPGPASEPPDAAVGGSPGVATLAVAFPEIQRPDSACRPVAVAAGQTASAAVECPHPEVAPGAKVVYFQWATLADTQRWQADQIQKGTSLDGIDRWDVDGVPQGTLHARSTAPGVATSAVYGRVPYGFLMTTPTLAESDELLSQLPLLPSSQIPA